MRDSRRLIGRWTGAPPLLAALAPLLAVTAPLLLILALAWPLLFADTTFNDDWLNHLWYLWHQSRALRADGAPSLFLDYSHGVLYPIYAFYGGTLYALAGALSLALGDAPLQAYVLTYLIGFAAAYGGWFWMARTFGVGRVLAHVPGLLFVTAAPYLTMIYGLGDWPEFLAVSSLPLLIASALSVLRADRLRGWPALALAGSAVVLFGSHLLTDIWGSTLLILVVLALLACVPQARRGLTRAGALRCVGLVLPALLLSAWFLLPTVAYESQTVIANAYPHFRKLLRATMYTVAARHLFTLSRARIAHTVLTLALPVPAIAWVLVSLAAALRTRRGAMWTRVLLVLSVATVLIALAMTHAAVLLALPRPYAGLQFGFRLESYVLLGISGAVLAALALAAEGERLRGRSPWGRRWSLLLAPIALVAVLGAVQQIDVGYPTGRSPSGVPGSYLDPVFEQEGLLDYVDDRLPIRRRRLPRVEFPPGTLREDRAAVRVRGHPGAARGHQPQRWPRPRRRQRRQDRRNRRRSRRCAAHRPHSRSGRRRDDRDRPGGHASRSSSAACSACWRWWRSRSELLWPAAKRLWEGPLRASKPISRKSAIYRATIAIFNDRS